jgi:hypothetical protein
MSEPRQFRWRTWAAVLLLILLPVLGYLVIRSDASPDNQRRVKKAPAAQTAPAPPPAPSPAPTAVERRQLIEAAARAASAYAAGQPPSSENMLLAGRRFILRLPFGCAGAAPEPDALGSAGWHYDLETQTLRAQVTPQVWTEAPWAAAAASQPFEAAEGFWITRPWSFAETCPAPSPGSAEQPSSPETLGIARFFEPGSRRSARRNGEAYSFSRKVPPGQAPGPQGLRLLIEGRLSVDPSRSPVGCWAASPDQRPICIFNARFDRVAITDASGERVFAEWKD